MSKEKTNGLTTVAATNGATSKGNGLKEVAAIQEQPKAEAVVKEIDKLAETNNAVTNNLLKPVLQSAEDRIKSLPIITALAKKITTIETRVGILKEMQAIKTGDGEKMVLHINKDTILNVDNPGAITQILALLVSTNVEKLAEAKTELQQFNF